MHHELLIAAMLALTLFVSACGRGIAQGTAEAASLLPPASLPKDFHASYCDRYISRKAQEACHAGLELAGK
jgi:hypothetical protein